MIDIFSSGAKLIGELSQKREVYLKNFNNENSQFSFIKKEKDIYLKTLSFYSKYNATVFNISKEESIKDRLISNLEFFPSLDMIKLKTYESSSYLFLDNMFLYLVDEMRVESKYILISKVELSEVSNVEYIDEIIAFSYKGDELLITELSKNNAIFLYRKINNIKKTIY